MPHIVWVGVRVASQNLLYRFHQTLGPTACLDFHLFSFHSRHRSFTEQRMPHAPDTCKIGERSRALLRYTVYWRGHRDNHDPASSIVTMLEYSACDAYLFCSVATSRALVHSSAMFR